jgi:hypothetical protein
MILHTPSLIPGDNKVPITIMSQKDKADADLDPDLEYCGRLSDTQRPHNTHDSLLVE